MRCMPDLGAARGSAAEELRQDLGDHIGERSDARQQCDGQDPEHVSSGPDHVHDERGLDERGTESKRGSTAMTSGCATPGRRAAIVARNAGSPPAVGQRLALRHANAPLHVAAVGPADVRQRIAEHALRARIDGDFHFAAVESRRRTIRLLRQEPDVHQLGRASCRSCAARRRLPAARLTGLPTLSAAMRGIGRTA